MEANFEAKLNHVGLLILHHMTETRVICACLFGGFIHTLSLFGSPRLEVSCTINLAVGGTWNDYTQEARLAKAEEDRAWFWASKSPLQHRREDW